jgi:hypothetical protein
MDGVGSKRIQDVDLSNAMARFRIFLTAVPFMDTLAEIPITQIRFKRKVAKVLDVFEGSPGEVVIRKLLLDKVFGYYEGVKTRTSDSARQQTSGEPGAKVAFRRPWP